MPGVEFSGTLSLKIDTGAGTLTVGGDAITLKVFGQSLTADHLSFEQVTSGATRTIRLNAEGLVLTLGDPNGVNVTVTQNGAIEVLVTPAGITGDIAATIAINGLASTGRLLARHD